MRLVKVSVPQGAGSEIAEIAFAQGIGEVSWTLEKVWTCEGEEQTREVVNARSSTPVAKRYLQALQQSRWGSHIGCTMTVRQPQSIHSRASLAELTLPLGVPLQDLRCELWQFSHVTAGFVGRVLCASLLLAHGIVEDHLLNILGGLLFMPLLPCLMAIALGSRCGDRALVGHGLRAWLTALLVLTSASAAYGWLLQPTIAHREGTGWLVSLGLSAIVGVAAALGDLDDAGKRELIGLAAASQLAMLPAWAALAGVTGTVSPTVALEKLASVFLNAGAIAVTAGLTFWWSEDGMR
jgi:hypothetical protein